MNVVFLGATKGIGRALARRMADRGDRLFLLGRDPKDLDRSARDLEACGAPAPVGTGQCDLAKPAGVAPALAEADAALGGFDTAVLTAAVCERQEELEADPERCDRLLQVDFVSSVRFCEAVRKLMMERGGGTLCAFSSVAGERGRKRHVLYGAAKAGLSHYLDGLDHRHRSGGLRTVCVKPGFVRTGMTEGLRPPPFAGEPDAVARRVLRAIDRGTPVVYAPPIWRLAGVILRLAPRTVMRRVEF